MKRTLVIAAAFLLPVMILAATDMSKKGSPAYTAIEMLSAAGAAVMEPVKDAYTRKEAAVFTKQAVGNLLSDEGSPDKETLEAAFGLMQEFQTDLMEQGMKLSEVQQKMIDLKVMQERLNLKEIKDRQDLLFGMIGVKINGEAAGYMTDVIIYGNKTGNARRYTPLTQYIDLMFTASSGRNLTAEAVFRMENIFGGNWGSQDIYGVRKFTITGDFPAAFKLGDYQAKLTPFTIWSRDDDREMEAKIFRDKREMNKKELYLEEGSWPVTGGSINYKTELFGAGIEAKVFAARLQEASKNNYQTAAEYAQTYSSPFIFAYDQYMWAGRVSSDFTLKDMLDAGVNFVEIRDIKGTGTNQTAPCLDNYTASADAKVKLFGIAEATAEFAYSAYYVNNSLSPESWQNKYITDTALMTGLKAGFMNTKLEAEFFVVGNSFTAYAAQTRVYDEYNNYQYLTQNNTWNISETIPAYIIATKVYPFTRYNNVILASYYPVGYNLMPAVYYENNASPYGDSTPNRQGVKARISGNYLDGMIAPYAKFLMSSEIVSYLPGSQFVAPREFMVMEAGAKVNIAGVKVYGSYKYELTDNGYTGGSAHLVSGIINAGAEYTLWSRLTVSAGFKNIAFKGSEYPYTYTGTEWAYSAKTDYDHVIMSYGAGLEYEIVKQAAAKLSFTNTIITDRLNDDNSFGAQEVDAGVTLKF